MNKLLHLVAVTLLLVVAAAGRCASAHTMMMTLVQVSFAQPDVVDVRIETDLTVLLGSSARYYELATAPAQRQQEQLDAILPQFLDALQLFIGEERLQLQFQSFTAAQAGKAEFLDSAIGKHSTLTFVAALPASRGPLRVVSPLGALIDYPIAYTLLIPAAQVSITRWMEPGVHESPPIAWADKFAGVSAAAGQIDPDLLPWSQQLALYLRLGFRHIVPEGLDHILFVLGLFFLGITWRKLVAQTTVFTIAHATTLFLSVYGIFRLPGQFVEPAIALSITVIATENVFRPRLGFGRLAIVFLFGLIHGLGFASSLSDVPFPKKDFLIALLGFNFGVDAGQLFVIGLAFLAVGWFRNRPWFRNRIAIPCSLAIAAVGLYWAVERIWSYAAA
ncbi:MAG: HupE/UreJ family protein [Pseudomonadota bacterium]